MQQQQQQQQTQTQPIYLFVSRNCEHCPSIIQKMKSNQELAQITQLIEIETTPNLPQGLTRVPAILHKGQLVMGTQALEWVDNYGQLDAAPMNLGVKGASDNYATIEGLQGGGNNSSSWAKSGFSMLGESSGSDGIKPDAPQEAMRGMAQQLQQPQQQMMQQQQMPMGGAQVGVQHSSTELPRQLQSISMSAKDETKMINLEQLEQQRRGDMPKPMQQQIGY